MALSFLLGKASWQGRVGVVEVELEMKSIDEKESVGIGKIPGKCRVRDGERGG